MEFFRRPQTFQAEERSIEDAEHRILELCMAAKGHEVVFPPATSDQIIARVVPNLRFRRQHGYGFVEQRPVEAREVIPATEEGRERLAYKYFGDESERISIPTPVGKSTMAVEGCWGFARWAVHGSVLNSTLALDVPRDYSAMIGHQIAEDPDYIGTPMRRWSDCMKARGHSYADLNGPYYDAMYAYQYADPKPTAVSDRERRVALDDGECQIAVGLPTLVRRLQVEHVARLPLEQRRQLEEIVDVRTRSLRRAERIVEQLGTGG